MGVKPSKYSDRHPGGDAQKMIGDGMRVRQGFRAAMATVLAGTALAATIVVVDGGECRRATASSAPGVTSNSITVGTISTQTGDVWRRTSAR